MSTYDFSELTNEDMAGSSIAPGDAHAMIIAVEENPTTQSGFTLDGLQVTFAIAAHSVPGQVNKQHRELFDNPDSEERFPGQRKIRLAMLAKLASATGIVKAALPGQSNVQINWNELVGKQVCIRLKKTIGKAGTKSEGKEYINIDSRDVAIFSPFEDAAKNFPKNQQLLAMVGGQAPAAATVQQQQPATVQQPAQQQPAHPVSLPQPAFNPAAAVAQTPTAGIGGNGAASAPATDWNKL